MQKILEGPCYRENCIGPMKYVDGIYVCANCGLASLPENYISWLKAASFSNDSPDDDYVGVPGYDELYDDEGNYIFCPYCYDSMTPLKLKDDQVICPRCASTMTWDEFDNYIGRV